MKKSTTRACFTCGSKLILINKKTQKIEGAKFTQTIIEYHCSNAVCQKQKDQEKKKRLKILKEREKAEKEKAKNRKNGRKNITLGKAKKK